MESNGLIFINIDPRSKGDLPEHRMVIRSKAGQHRPIAASPTEPLRSVSINSKPWKPYHRIRLKAPAKKKRGAPKELSDKDEDQISPSRFLRDAVNGLVLVLDQKIETLGGTTFDPFKSLPLPEVPETILSGSLWMFVYEYLPLFWALPRSNSLDARIQTLFYSIKESKSCLVASIFTVLCHKRARERQAGIEETSTTRGLKYHALYCQYEGTKLLRQEVEEQHQLSHMNLMTMLLLGCSTWDRSLAPERPAFVPFMQSLGLLDSMIEYEPERHHVNTCFEYIRSQGGISSLDMDLTRFGIAYSSVLDATRLGSRPPFPYHSLVASTEPATLQARLQFTSTDVEELFGWYKLVDLPETLMEAFYAVREYEHLLTYHLQGMLDKMAKAEELADLRLLVQHHVLDIPSRLECTRWTDTLYECCRMALRLYSMGVVFPMTLASAPWASISAHLLQLLTRDDDRVLREACQCHPGAFRMLAWTAVVGGISAYKTSLYEEFVQVLRRQSKSELLGDSFESFRASTLSPILWFNYSCDAAGEAFWKRIQLQ